MHINILIYFCLKYLNIKYINILIYFYLNIYILFYWQGLQERWKTNK